MGQELKSTRKLWLKELKEFSTQSRIPATLKILIATEDDYVDAEEFVVKVGLWLRLLDIEEGKNASE